MSIDEKTILQIRNTAQEENKQVLNNENISRTLAIPHPTL